MSPETYSLIDEPQWYKDAIIYEVPIKSFSDSNGDGIGDFQGLISKLDYLKALGISAIWILPFYPSPLRDDGYDISNYYGVHPDYGTLKDFKELLKKAHDLGLKVITELVINHTSDQHKWFQKSRRAEPGSRWRDYYVWSDTWQIYQDARIIFQDYETSNWTWDPVAKAYYWHRFYSHQPDLNFDNPLVQKAIFKVLDFWLGLGVDGLRLDAVPYLFEREGTNCENLPETHNFLKKLRQHVDKNYSRRMLLAEANQWPEDAIAYFGAGDECQMAFHFPIMPRMFMSMWMEDRFPLMDMIEQTPEIPENCQWALFLRNHDELTLEMVSDEERDYMYNVYAKDPRARINLGIRRRLAPLLGNNRRKIELLTFLLLSLPGTPVLYYGDEIGMGDNFYLGDRNGVRTPMHWSPDRNAGFSKANPQKLYLPVIIDPEYNYESINVENQEYNHSSLLWWMRRVIAMRKGFKAFSRGSIQFLLPNNHRILAFIRKFEEEILLVVINLSRFSQAVELDLSEYAGYVPEEAFSGNKFPVIRESPYVLTMGFNDYFWFLLKRESDFSLYTQEAEQLPSLSVSRDWEHFFQTSPHHKLENIVIPPHLRNSRWFAAKARTIRQVRILENIPLKHNQDLTYLLFIDVHYTEGASERYTLPLSLASGELESRIRSESPQALLAEVETKDMEGVLYDGMFNPDFQQALFKLIMHRQTIQGQKGALSGLRGKQLNRLLGTQALPLRCKPLKGEQSNTSILYGDTFIFKLYRKLEEGLNPDAEINRFLTDKTQFDNIPPFAGEINYREQGRENAVLGLLQGFVPNEGDAWTYTLDAVERFFDQIQVTEDGVLQEIELPSSYLQVEPSKIPESLLACIGGFFFEMISLLGKRTAEMHLALTEHQNDPNFAPEPFSKLYQRSVYQSMRYLVRRSMQGMQQNLHFIPQANQQQAQEVLNQEGNVLKRLEKIAEHKIETVKIRIHGDYHLGQVLFTGKDFLIIDFEGEPARPMSERRLKRSPIRDLAGMLRSFHYAIYTVYYRRISVRPESAALLQKWLEPWHRLISGVYLRSYLDTAQQASFIPARTKDFEVLLQAYLLEKAVYELGYELNNRPDWAIIPLLGIESILNS